MNESWLLDTWEDAQARPPVRRPLALLRAAAPDASEDELGGLRLGERERRLLGLHERLFGPALRGVCECPACGERVEVGCDTRSLRAAAPDPAAVLPAALEVACAGFRVTCRLPTTEDIACAAGADDAAAARRVLLARCVTAAWRAGAPCAIDELPHAVTVAVADRMEEADPLGDIRLELRCPACDAGWTSACDVAPFLLTRLDGRARQILGEVHALASAYGWTQDEVLSLTPARRHAYLDLVDR